MGGCGVIRRSGRVRPCAESALDVAHHRAEQLARFAIERTARCQALVHAGKQLAQALRSHTASTTASGPAAESGLRCAGCGALDTEQILPGVFATETLALFREFYSLGRERDHVGLAIHIDLALQQLVQLGSHCVLSVTNPRVVDGSSQTAAVYSRRQAPPSRRASPTPPTLRPFVPPGHAVSARYAPR